MPYTASKLELIIIGLIQYKILRYQGKDTTADNGWEQGITAENIQKSLKEFCANLFGEGYYQMSRVQVYIKLLSEVFEIDLGLYLSYLQALSG